MFCYVKAAVEFALYFGFARKVNNMNDYLGMEGCVLCILMSNTVEAKEMVLISCGEMRCVRRGVICLTVVGVVLWMVFKSPCRLYVDAGI